eukprot:TRINITY_DN12187_c0_g1_i2.p3 TRINITY_DN12187_c0_g1~~TRINITY_DN12187_c0_g1_i2.p3  ORF type:complete len:113 (+),score=34.01 TRINITY_DN12187_c0_g1_i2:49-387(+)
MQLKDRYPTFTKACKLSLPGKKLIGNRSEEFLDKRAAGLVKWLEVMMSHDFFEKSIEVKKVQATGSDSTMSRLCQDLALVVLQAFASMLQCIAWCVSLFMHHLEITNLIDTV